MRTNQEKLGTMLDKVSRIEKTVGKLSTALGLSKNFIPVLEEAAGLAMSDLATSVVTEFTSLAGIMGRHYALRDGYSLQVNKITFWHNPLCFVGITVKLRHRKSLCREILFAVYCLVLMAYLLMLELVLSDCCI